MKLPHQKNLLQQYKALKENFCSEFPNEKAWGIHQNSGTRLEAYNKLIYFLRQSKELVEHDEDLSEKILHLNVKLLIGNEFRLPNSLKRSMRRSLTREPFENWNKKFSELLEELKSEANSLSNYLINISKWYEESEIEDEPFPYMRGIPSYGERCGYVDYGDPSPFSDEFKVNFREYLDENKLSSLYGDPFASEAEESPAESEEGSTVESSLENCSESGQSGSGMENAQTPFGSFSSKLRRIRRRIYQKIEAKVITKADLDKYEVLVGQFVKKFGENMLSDWEIGLWQRKVITTRNDALDAPFEEHLFNDVLSDVSSLEYSLSNLDQNDSMGHEGFEESKVEVDSVEEFFANQKVLENLLDNLPSVPNSEDEELEERLRKLRSFDKSDETKEVTNDIPEFLEEKALVKKILIPLHAENENRVEESTAKNDEVKDIKSDNRDKREPADGKTDAMLKEAIPTSFDSDAFDAREDFNDWFENELRKKKKNPKSEEVLAFAHSSYSEDIFKKKVDENSEYKQKRFPDSSDFQNQDGRSPDLLIFMRACFILLLTMCKTLNEQSLKIASFSNPNYPVISVSPTQSPLPISRPLPCSVNMYQRTNSCHCVQFVTVLASVTGMMSSAGMVVAVWYRWTKRKVQELKEKVIIKVVYTSLGLGYSSENAIKSIEELKKRIVN